MMSVYSVWRTAIAPERSFKKPLPSLPRWLCKAIFQFAGCDRVVPFFAPDDSLVTIDSCCPFKLNLYV
ncbi:MAG TPA: hypothetical protein V6C98_00715 [Thermosynechococcaceae cyanobacterium]